MTKPPCYKLTLLLTQPAALSMHARATITTMAAATCSQSSSKVSGAQQPHGLHEHDLWIYTWRFRRSLHNPVLCHGLAAPNAGLAGHNISTLQHTSVHAMQGLHSTSALHHSLPCYTHATHMPACACTCVPRCEATYTTHWASALHALPL